MLVSSLLTHFQCRHPFVLQSVLSGAVADELLLGLAFLFALGDVVRLLAAKILLLVWAKDEDLLLGAFSRATNALWGGKAVNSATVVVLVVLFEMKDIALGMFGRWGVQIGNRGASEGGVAAGGAELFSRVLAESAQLRA